MDIEQDEQDINRLLNECAEVYGQGATKYRGMTYEQGIVDAIRWLTDAEEPYPLDDDD